MIINIKLWYSYDNQLNITNYITKYIIVILPQCLLPIIDFPSRNRRKPLFRSHPPTSRSVVTVQLICLQKSPAQTRSPWNSPSVCKLSTSTVVFRGYVFRMNEGWVHFIVLRCRSGIDDHLFVRLVKWNGRNLRTCLAEDEKVVGREKAPLMEMDSYFLSLQVQRIDPVLPIQCGARKIAELCCNSVSYDIVCFFFTW